MLPGSRLTATTGCKGNEFRSPTLGRNALKATGNSNATWVRAAEWFLLIWNEEKKSRGGGQVVEG